MKNIEKKAGCLFGSLVVIYYIIKLGFLTNIKKMGIELVEKLFKEDNERAG